MHDFGICTSIQIEACLYIVIKLVMNCEYKLLTFFHDSSLDSYIYVRTP